MSRSPFLLQTALGHSQVATGFLMTPWPAVAVVMALIAGRLADRVSLLCGIGLLMLGAGMAFPGVVERRGIGF